MQADRATSRSAAVSQGGRGTIMRTLRLRQTWPLHALIFPGVLVTLVFHVFPLIGFSIAFQDYNPTKGFLGSAWIGLSHFRYMLSFPDTVVVFRNTILIAGVKIATGLFFALLAALLLNELRSDLHRRTVSTLLLFPYFLSWVILGGIFVDVFSLRVGAINRIVTMLGGEPIFFLGEKGWFLVVLFVTYLWQNTGYTAVIFLAAIVTIDQQQYEAAYMDGASRLQQAFHVTLPNMAPIIVLMSVLAVGSILSAGFDQIFNLYNPLVYEVSDIIDTFVYRVGLLNAQFSIATAMGMLKSIVAMVLVLASFKIAEKYGNYEIF